MPITGPVTKHWAEVSVIRTTDNSEVTVFTNDATPKYFQGIQVPYYPDIANHIDCGGTQTMYLNAPYAVSRTKTCGAGLAGSLVIYAKPGGIFTSLISQPAVDALVAADITANAQTYADTHGTCS